MRHCENGCGAVVEDGRTHLCPFHPTLVGVTIDNTKQGSVIPCVRHFETGATRSADASRYDPEGFLSPLVLERFSEYMQKHRLQPDGSVRSSDNWQKGMPKETYMKGHIRHTLHAWTRHRGLTVRDPLAAADLEEDLCAILFNVQGYLYELLKAKESV